MPNLTDLEIRNGILSTIESATGDAVLLNRWVLALGLGESIPYLKNSSGKIHGYMVSRSGIGSRVDGVGSKKYIITQPYKLWGFKGFKLGQTSGLDELDELELRNSEDEFSLEVDAVLMEIMKAPRLAWDDLDYNFVKHENWQIEDIDVFDFGNEKVHVAQGTLEITLRVQATT